MLYQVKLITLCTLFCWLLLGSIPVRRGEFGQGNGSILLDDLMCDGDENSLFECAGSDDIGSHDCSHSEDAGVRCEGATIAHIHSSESHNFIFVSYLG